MQGRYVVKKTIPILVAIALAISVSFGLAARADAASSEQIVFSGIGFSPSANAPVGLWIWCESAESSNPYAGECNGAMYFYSLGITKHVDDVVPLQEPSEGQYLMTVASRDGSVSCTLENDPPATSGPTNTVHITCSSPLSFTDGLSTNAVVSVAGP
jgi:hypothetical protein